MDPQDFQPPPEDVVRDRLKIDATPEDLKKEVEEKVAELKALAKEAAEKTVTESVDVSISPRGRIRKNGPCPCGSGRKFKKCCIDDVKSGEKPLPSSAAVRAFIRSKTK